MGSNSQSRKWALVINNPSEAGLDHSAIKEIFQGPVFHGVLLRRQSLPEQVNVTDTKGHSRVIVNDFRGGHAVPDILDEPEHLRVFLRSLRRGLAL